MIKFKVIFFFIPLLLLFNNCNVATTSQGVSKFHESTTPQGIPAWFLDIPNIEGKIIITSTGEGRLESLVFALLGFDRRLGTSARESIRSSEGQYESVSDENSIDNISVMTDGKISITGISSEHQREINNISTINSFIQNIQVNYTTTADKSLKVEYLSSELDNIATEYFFSVASNSVTVDELFTELQSYGFSFKHAIDETGNHFLMLSISEEKVNSLLNKIKK